METVYGVQLLDDLHAYFPDILYEPERFESVQDLLGYIQEQAQEHFNLYSRGRRLHTASRGSPAAAAPQPAAPVPTPAATTATPAAGGAGAAAATVVPPLQPRMQATPLYSSFYQGSAAAVDPIRFRSAAAATAPAPSISSFLFDFGTEREDPSTQLLSSLLGLAFTGGAGGRGARGLASNFMDPVVVRPTREQIDAASEVIVLEEALESNCAICQDRMEAHNPTRKINACGHSFHTECIDTWFERSVSCPVCRHDIREPAGGAGAAAATAATDAAPAPNQGADMDFVD